MTEPCKAHILTIAGRVEGWGTAKPVITFLPTCMMCGEVLEVKQEKK